MLSCKRVRVREEDGDSSLVLVRQGAEQLSGEVNILVGHKGGGRMLENADIQNSCVKNRR